MIKINCHDEFIDLCEKIYKNLGTMPMGLSDFKPVEMKGCLCQFEVGSPSHRLCRGGSSLIYKFNRK